MIIRIFVISYTTSLSLSVYAACRYKVIVIKIIPPPPYTFPFLHIRSSGLQSIFLNLCTCPSHLDVSSHTCSIQWSQHNKFTPFSFYLPACPLTSRLSRPSIAASLLSFPPSLPPFPSLSASLPPLPFPRSRQPAPEPVRSSVLVWEFFCGKEINWAWTAGPHQVP